jgi:hypothetical protein
VQRLAPGKDVVFSSLCESFSRDRLLHGKLKWTNTKATSSKKQKSQTISIDGLGFPLLQRFILVVRVTPGGHNK